MSSACRLLCIKLTDGKASCKALEMRLLQGAEGDAVAPGAKVLLAGAAVKAGIVLVDSRSLKVLLPPPYAQDNSFCDYWSCTHGPISGQCEMP